MIEDPGRENEEDVAGPAPPPPEDAGAPDDVDEGWIAPPLREEFPKLLLCQLDVPGRDRRSGRATRRRLSVLADRFTGGKAITLRLDPVPSAYRAFFRQVGLDPDHHRIPVEQVAVRRMLEGGYLSRGRVEDAITLAVVETGVPVLAFDADRLDGPLGLRLSARDERLGEEGRTLAGREIVVADASRPVAVLFGDASADAAVTRESSRLALAAVGVEGVPRISVEEALWMAAEVVSDGS